MIILLVVYLSFFKPPSVDLPLFPGVDKLVHFLMYGGMSGVIWLEFLWNHRREQPSLRKGVIGAALCPILFSGGVELMQEQFTSYRGGEWLDFFANTSGVIVASLIAWYMIRPFLSKRYFKE